MHCRTCEAVVIGVPADTVRETRTTTAARAAGVGVTADMARTNPTSSLLPPYAEEHNPGAGCIELDFDAGAAEASPMTAWKRK